MTYYTICYITYRTTVIGYTDLADFCNQVNALKMRKMISVKPTSAKSIDNRIWVSVHYEVQQ